jgi:glycosyltransferase involved in cell wall biosynthesis
VKDLLVTVHTPVLRSGHVMRTYGIARALAAHGGLTLLYVNFDAPEPDSAFQEIPGIELHGVTPSRGVRRLLAYAGARLAGVPDALARGVSSELGSAALHLAERPGCGRVIADGPVAAATLARLARRRPIIYNAHNLESGFRHQIDKRRFGGAQTLRRFERRLLASATESWMVSEADIAGARELCPTARLRYVPNVIDLARITPVSLPQPERRVIFVASFFYTPNRNGLSFLLDEVFPRVWAELPDTRLTLVGAGLQELPGADPRVEPLGFVEDLGAAYASASCAVVPLLQGGGTPLKFIEALAYGLPVVATPRAAAGLAVSDGRDCLIAEGAEQFAQALIRILRDGGVELGRRGRELVAGRYSIEALSELLAVGTPSAGS